MKWQNNPVIVSFNDETTSIGMIPFPAVTICTTKKFIKDKIDSKHLIETFNKLQLNEISINNLSRER